MNNWLNKLERKFGRYAIPNLMYYIIILYAAGFVLNLVNPLFYYQYLSLDASMILKGQVWRIFTFIIQAPSSSLVFIIFSLYLYYMIGKHRSAACHGASVSAGLSYNRGGFTRDRALVDGCGALDDLAVRRDLLTRLYDDKIALFKLIGRQHGDLFRPIY